ncbi:MAG TPA: hypothetical protein VK635_19110 [Bradyrhizobium sp.]|nr:hypothetical protein [Bradyrhizobium sp.]
MTVLQRHQCLIGDQMNGHKVETMFSRHRMGNAGQWLVDEAARLYPNAFQ